MLERPDLSPLVSGSISAIVPTIGRADSLRALLESLAIQTRKVDEVIVADGNNDCETATVIADAKWQRAGLVVKHITANPPNAVRQRQAAIDSANGDFLLFLDDDVVLEAACVANLYESMQAEADVVGVTADFNNQCWPEPTRVWQVYLKYGLGFRQREWQGRVVGPLLRFGYNPVPALPKTVEWFSTGTSLIRRSAYLAAGGFSDFFLHRCTINEDIDLSLKISRTGRILFCPLARMAHHHAPGGRVSLLQAAEDDLFNRFFILRRTLGYGLLRSFGLMLLYFSIETTSHFLGCLSRLDFEGFVEPLSGRIRAFARILIPIAR